MYFHVKVEHYYLHSAQKGYQTRLRKRAKNGRPTYTFTGIFFLNPVIQNYQLKNIIFKVHTI